MLALISHTIRTLWFCLHPHKSVLDGYTQSDIIYRWTDGDPVKNYQDIKMAQFLLTDMSQGNLTMGSNHGTYIYLHTY